MTIILVDGIWGTGAVFASLRAKLTASGHRCLVPSLHPNNAVHGVADLAEKLKRFIDSRVEPDATLTIVGFSLGCIVTRYYLQQLGGYRRTKAFFALSGPHRGTWTAYGYIGKGARDLRPGSALLRQLDASSPCLSCVALYAFWTPFDLMIVPATSAEWRAATTLKIWTPLHRFMPTNTRVQTEILRHLQRLCPPSTAVR
jgi:triacylglycerol lipase